MQRKFSQFMASAAPAGLHAGLLAAIGMGGLCASAPAFADTTVSTGTTANYQTSAAGNVTISSTGTLTGASATPPATPSPVISVNSNNTVSINTTGVLNGGTATTAQSGAIGVSINPGVTTTVTNAGTINLLESFTPQTISSGVLFSAVSGVSGRYGIYGAAGAPIVGNITNSGLVTGVTTAGTIIVDGENSAGIQLDGPLTGTFNTQGTISVLGDNSYGVKLANVTGNVTVGGTVSVTGSGAQGVVLAGNVTGAVVIDGAVTSNTGYTDSLGQALTLADSRVNTSTPLVAVLGNVTGGVLINAPTTSTSTDTNRGTLTSYGNNPALQIGGATATTIGTGTTNNGSFAVGIDGSVTASTTIAATNVYGLVIGGNGGTVTLGDGHTQGIEVYGTITAATANGTAYAMKINSGSVVGTILNTGTIKATAGQQSGNVFGIQDLSGSVNVLTNQGYITAVGITPQASAAVDLRSDTAGVKFTQSYTAANLTTEATDKTTTGYTPDTAPNYAGIVGDIYIGTTQSTGANTVAIQGGTVNGDAYLGGSNAVTLADTAKWVGNINFIGTGTQTVSMADNSRFTGTLAVNNNPGTLTVGGSAQFFGTITNGGNFNVAVNGGLFGANTTAVTTISSLNVASGGGLRVFVDAVNGRASQLVANSATFASGAKLSVQVNSLLAINTPVQYDVLKATTLTGASTLTNSSLSLPVLFNGTITTDANNVYVTLGRATAAQLGLTQGQSSAYSAIINDAAQNSAIQNTLLGIYDAPTLRERFNELLPNYAGGTFDTVTRGSRIVNQHVQDDSSLFSISNASAWLEPVVFRGTRTYGDTPGFKTTGAGISMGVEKVTSVGNLGLTLAYISGDAKTEASQAVKSTEFTLGAFWRKSSGPFYLWASGNLGRESFKSTRTFFGSYTTATTAAVTTTNFTNTATGHWAGWSAALTAGVSYTAPLGEHFSLRPRGVIEYDRLKENRYIEGGDTPIALTVLGRTSSQTVATTTLTAAWSAGPSSHEGRPFTVELEGGRRTWLAGNLGTTTGTFETGDTFSLNGGHLPSALVGGLSILQGGLDYTWRIGTTAERGTDKGVSYGVRASLAIAL